MMGPGIAATMALAGHRVALWGRTRESVDRGLASARGVLSFLEREDVVSTQEAVAAQAAVRGTSDLADAVRGATVIFESIPEDMGLKQAFFQELEALAGPTAILASNTSGLRISEIAARLQHP